MKKKCASQIYGYKKKKERNGTLSRHLALVTGHWLVTAPPRCGVVQEVELPASLLWLT